MLTIELGKTYRLRSGDGPIEIVSIKDNVATGALPSGARVTVWADSGQYNKHFEGGLDIVAEWVEPTRPETPPDQPLTKHGLLNLAIEATRDRGLNYGRPEDNFRRIARLWNAHLANRYGDNYIGDTPIGIPSLDEHDVVQLMILMKVARLENSPNHIDSLVDVAGYAACGGEIAGRASNG